MAALPTTMKALVKESAGTSYEYKDVPVPVPRGDELLVRVGKVALCGSDIALYQWNNGAVLAIHVSICTYTLHATWVKYWSQWMGVKFEKLHATDV